MEPRIQYAQTADDVSTACLTQFRNYHLRN